MKTSFTPWAQLVASQRLAWPRLHPLMIAWVIFLTLSVLYCYVYAGVVGGHYTANLRAVLLCVAYDWLLWVVVSPLLVYAAQRFSFRWHVLVLLLVSTILVGLLRVVLELSTGSLGPYQVWVIYLPRYFFMAACIIGGAVIYRQLTIRSVAAADKTSTGASCQRESAALPEERLQTLVVSKGSARVLLAVEDIICVSANGNYLHIHTQMQSYLLRATLKQMSQQLPSRQFVRIHRSHLVRLDAISSVSSVQAQVNLNNGMSLPLGLSYKNQLPHFA